MERPAFPKLTVHWFLGPDLNLPFVSFILSGLAALRRTEQIDLISRPTDATEGPVRLALKVEDPARKLAATIALEFDDREEKVSLESLAHVDAYFKQECGPASRRAAAEFAQKIHPLGITFAALSQGSFSLILAVAGARFRGRPLHRAIRQSVGDVRLWLRLATPDSVVAPSYGVRSRRIVFQPRLWPSGPDPSGVFTAANRERLSLVRELRDAFPTMTDSIGLVHSPITRSVAHELLLRRRVRTRGFHRQLRESVVAVNSQGLSGSVGWKLAEYMAAGCAIVSKPIVRELPSPILEGTHYLAYQTPAECVKQCQRLLSNPQLAERISTANRRYYHDHVSPASLVQRILTKSLALAQAERERERERTGS